MRRTKSCRKMYKHIQWTRFKKSFGLYARQPRKNLHTGISVNKPKLPVTKHDQTLILAHMYDTSRYTANTKKYSWILHTHTTTVKQNIDISVHTPERGCVKTSGQEATTNVSAEQVNRSIYMYSARTVPYSSFCDLKK